MVPSPGMPDCKGFHPADKSGHVSTVYSSALVDGNDKIRSLPDAVGERLIFGLVNADAEGGVAEIAATNNPVNRADGKLIFITVFVREPP